MMRTLIKAAAIASAVLGGLAAAPAAAQGRHDRGGYDNDYRGDSSRWGGDRGDRYDRGRSYRRDRDDDGRGYRRHRDRDDDGGRHRHWRGRDR